MLGRRWGIQEPPACPMVLPHLGACSAFGVSPLAPSSRAPASHCHSWLTSDTQLSQSVKHRREIYFALLSSVWAGWSRIQKEYSLRSRRNLRKPARRSPRRGAWAQDLGKGTLPSSGPKMPLLGSARFDASSSMSLQRQACRIKSTVWESHRPRFKTGTRVQCVWASACHL